MTANNDLTDRYVLATLRRIPENQRDDIESELRASIADAIDGKRETGLDAATAETEVLLELGDPDRLAAGYSGRPLYLIGPALFLDYWRLLKVLLWAVVPIVFVVLTVIGIIAAKSPGALFADASLTASTVALHLAFWTTLVFAILERTGNSRSMTDPWTLDYLPVLPTPSSVKFAETIWTIATVALTIAAIFLQQYLAWPLVDGQSVPVLNPELWSFWIPVLIAILVVELVFEIVKYRIGHWTISLAVVYTLINVAFASVMIWLLATYQLLNPAFFDAAGWPEGDDEGGWLTLIAILTIAVLTVWSSVDGFVRTNRR